MIRRHKDGSQSELGILIDGLDRCDVYGYRATVFKIHLFELKEKMPKTLEGLKDVPHETFDTFEEVVEAGWEPD